MKLTLLIISILGLAFCSCFRKPNYPDAPEITFVSLSIGKAAPGTGTDSIVTEISFRDGNSDLGLDDKDTIDEFAKYLPNAQLDINPRYYNLHLQLFLENAQGKFDTLKAIRNSNGQETIRYYNTRFPKIVNSGNPTDGVIRYPVRDLFFLAIPGQPFLASGRKYYFRAFIYDRAGNRSNTIFSPIQVVP
jgi:hypothetical protein